MTRTPYARFWLSLTAAFFLQLIELPDAMAAARPLWIPLVLVYWALAEPRVPTFVTAFLLGVMLDVILDSSLGQHASGFVLLVWFMTRLRGIFILLPLWQSTIALAPAWAGYCLLMALLDDLSRHRADEWLRWLPAVSTTLFWPMVYSLLETRGRKKTGE